MKRATIVTAAVVLILSSCAKPSLFQSWGTQIAEAPQRAATLDDVSLLLGTAPSRCDAIDKPAPVIGAGFNSKKAIVDSVVPNSPADAVGLKPQDRIHFIAGEKVMDSEQALRAMRQAVREGTPLKVETNRGTFLPVPRVPRAEQCYWDHRAGEVARSSGAAYVNQWGGSAGAGSSAYQRFFKASCRVHDGFVVACSANWQD